ncbi:MAG: SMC-Scp complex subunit ScpB [Candidatus Brocadiales bacterium]|nr:SMC-Scp complex subunit ScpB [Candidatus Bathyanammoxibius sp.]
MKEENPAEGENKEMGPVIEALLFATNQPLTANKLTEIIGDGKGKIVETIEQLRKDYDDTGRAFQIEEIAGGYLLLSRQQYHPWIARLEKKTQESKLSPAAMETLSIIAYKQPILRSTIEAIRGVESSQMLRSLMDKGLAKVVGKDETLGRPLLYGTTKRFLEYFGLRSLRDLPRTLELSS